MAELVSAARPLVRLFASPGPVRSARAVAALDGINGHLGRGTLRPTV